MWAEGLPPASPVARALAAAEEELRAKLDALQARDSARETEMDGLRDLVVAVRSLFERERLEHEEDVRRHQIVRAAGHRHRRAARAPGAPADERKKPRAIALSAERVFTSAGRSPSPTVIK